jgi:hypothetical protein
LESREESFGKPLEEEIPTENDNPTIEENDVENIEYEIESGEPEKHDVEMLSLFKLSDLKVLDKMDTWLRKVIVQLKDDKRI